MIVTKTIAPLADQLMGPDVLLHTGCCTLDNYEIPRPYYSRYNHVSPLRFHWINRAVPHNICFFTCEVERMQETLLFAHIHFPLIYYGPFNLN